MIRKKWNGDELLLSVETEDEFWKALTTGEAVELTRELGDQIGSRAHSRRGSWTPSCAIPSCSYEQKRNHPREGLTPLPKRQNQNLPYR